VAEKVAQAGVLDLAAPLSPVERYYFGAEFCPWLFPEVAQIEQALALARQAQRPLTLLTPVLSEFFFPRFEEALAAIAPQLMPQDEIVLSDWGALATLKKLAPQATLVLGRVLSGQKRGPRILALALSDFYRDYFQQGSVYSREMVALLQEVGIVRVELDNLLQGVAPLPEGLVGTLHLPYAMVSSSRNCPYREGLGDRGCPKECGAPFTLESDETAIPLLQRGNTQFLENCSLPDGLAEKRIDRVVRHSVLPL